MTLGLHISLSLSLSLFLISIMLRHNFNSWNYCYVNFYDTANMECQFLNNITAIQMHIKDSNKRRTFKQYVSYNVQQMKVSEI